MPGFFVTGGCHKRGCDVRADEDHRADARRRDRGAQRYDGGPSVQRVPGNSVRPRSRDLASLLR